MNICVCIKQVPDTNEIKVDPVTHTLVRKGVPSIVNPFDTYAQEVGVRLKEKLGGKVVVISMGPEQAKEAIKTCLSVGADAGYLISSRKFGGSDTLATSYILSEAIKAVEEKEGLKFDLILCGKQAVDGDTAQVGPEIAEHLGLPQITYALDIIEKDGDIQVKRECDEGYDMISTQLPAVVTVVRLPYEPRYPTIKSKMAAKKKEIPVLTEEDIPAISLERCGLSGSPTKVKKTYTPVTEKNGVKLEGMEAEDAAKEAIQSPLLETSIEGAKGVIINITGGEDLGLHEVNTAAELVQRSVDPEANIIFGTVTDPNMTDEIQITVIATGFEKNEPISSIGVDNIVSKTWEKKINSIPASSETNSSQNDLDIPSFLRKNKNKNM